MEFNFSITPYFHQNIVKVGPRLVPDGYTGDRREIQECVLRMSSILTDLGENSAKAQSLQKVITSGDRLRNSDHTVYLIGDPECGSKGLGTVTGLLKVGVKHLYLFDSSGNNHEVYANCVLDFYVHESKQRMGIGKLLFDHMLQAENAEPQHLAIDKPSPKLLSFLDKHYGLNTIIPQMNNFVLFEGFFDNRNDNALKEAKERVVAAGISSSTSRFLSGGMGMHSSSDNFKHEKERTSSLSSSSSPSAFGRPPAHRPVSTMGFILQQQPQTSETHSSPASVMAEEVDKEEDVALEESPEKTDQLDYPEVEELAIDDEKEEVLATPQSEDKPITPIEPVPCKVQAATPTRHIDLKFYHSSLW